MASRPFIGPTTVLNTAVSSTTTYTGTLLDMRNLTSACFVAVWTGTPTGTISIQGSQDKTTWLTMDITPASQPAGGAGSTLIDIGRTGVPYLQLSYTNASGSGTLVVTASAKGV